MKALVIAIATIIIFATMSAHANKTPVPEPDIIVYKQLENRDLHLHLFSAVSEKPAPCVLLIHSGGWSGGTPQRYYYIARRLYSMGYTVACLEYRLIRSETEPENTVFDAVADAQDGFRFLVQHAEELNIDPDRIIASGGSAGAHLAAGLALFDDYTDSRDKMQKRPAALILFNPVIDTSKEGYGNRVIGKDWEKISPLHRVGRDVPPTIIFHGTEDRTTPFIGAKRFHEAMLKAGNISELHPHEGGDHGYYTKGETFKQTMEHVKDFSHRHGLLP